MLSIEDLPGIEKLLKEKPTRLVIFESPTNPVTKVADIEHLTMHARAAGALTVLDNTFAGFHNHGAYDIDVYLHSLTKYASGHGDVMGGAIIARHELIAAMRKDIGPLGAALDPHAAFLIQRGMRTYFLRYERQCANALSVAEFLAQHPRVKQVRYPGLKSHPQHELARRQMRDFGTIVTIIRRATGKPAGSPKPELFSIAQRRVHRVTGDAAAAAARRRIYRRTAGAIAMGGPYVYQAGG